MEKGLTEVYRNDSGKPGNDCYCNVSQLVYKLPNKEEYLALCVTSYVGWVTDTNVVSKTCTSIKEAKRWLQNV